MGQMLAPATMWRPTKKLPSRPRLLFYFSTLLDSQKNIPGRMLSSIHRLQHSPLPLRNLLEPVKSAPHHIHLQICFFHLKNISTSGYPSQTLLLWPSTNVNKVLFIVPSKVLDRLPNVLNSAASFQKRPHCGVRTVPLSANAATKPDLYLHRRVVT